LFPKCQYKLGRVTRARAQISLMLAASYPRSAKSSAADQRIRSRVSPAAPRPERRLGLNEVEVTARASP
jgi:hypothetical protein